jgi:hypothetical protein
MLGITRRKKILSCAEGTLEACSKVTIAWVAGYDMEATMGEDAKTWRMKERLPL